MILFHIEREIGIVGSWPYLLDPHILSLTRHRRLGVELWERYEYGRLTSFMFQVPSSNIKKYQSRQILGHTSLVSTNINS
jgi:hypothetical protein